MQTMTLHLATLTFQAGNGYQETYHVHTWEQYHQTIRTMEGRGFAKVGENNRAPGF